MKSNKMLMVVLIALIAIVSVGSCSAGILDILNGDIGSAGTITIDCNDTNESGQLMIIEFNDIKQNENGTYNASQFGTNDGEWNGNVVLIPIENGKAEYNLSADTEMFAVDNYIVNITNDYGFSNDSAPTFDVKYSYKGEEVLSSSEHAYADQCDVSFGGDIYFINGTGFTDEDINLDLPDLQESYDSVMELLNSTDEK